MGIIAGVSAARYQPSRRASERDVVLVCAITAGDVAITYTLVRDHPHDLGVAPYGSIKPTRTTQVSTLTARASLRLLAHMGLIFGIYGATYMLYVTFIVTSMIDSYGMSQREAGGLWTWFGLLSIFAGVSFGWISDRIGRRMGMALAFVVLATAYLLIGFGSGMVGLYLSIILFGMTAWSVPVIMAASLGGFFGPAAAANTLAVLMLFFSVGQGVGPVIAGFLAERSGSFTVSYFGAGVAALLALGLIFLLQPPETDE